MRYEGCLLTIEESRKLIDDIDRWCRRTGTNYNKLVVVARVGPSLRNMVRVKGKRVTFAVAERLTSTMKRYRHGISRDEYRGTPKPWGGGGILPIAPKTEPVRIVSGTCHRCGAREGNCSHTRILSAQPARLRWAV